MRKRRAATVRLLDPNHPPIKFTGWLWRRLVVDAHRARDDGWLRRAVEAGWRLEDLIDRRTGRGLLVAIGGGMIIRVDNRSATIRSATGDGSKIGAAQAETNELLVGTPAAHSKPFLGGSPSRGPVVLGEFDRPTG